MKIYTNSKGESLPKVICAVVEFENKRLGQYGDDTRKLNNAFAWGDSNIFKDNNHSNWTTINIGEYDHFYSIFPTCKNSRGQELPEDIQVEIVEERLRQGTKENWMWLFDWSNSTKGYVYWHDVSNSDYTPTKSDDTFTQGEIVEVSNNEQIWGKREFIASYKKYWVTFQSDAEDVACWKFIRKIQHLELTLPELLTIAEEVKGTKVKLKS